MSPQKRRKGPGRPRLPKPEPEAGRDDRDRDVITLREAAEYLNCHYGTIYRLVRVGDFPAFRLGAAGGFSVRKSRSGLRAGAAVRPKSLLESLTAGRAVSVRLSRGGPQK